METELSNTNIRQYQVKLPELHEGQIEVAMSNARFKVLSAGRRWGKTRLGVWLCLEQAWRGKRSWWIAPTYSMALEGWKDLRNIGIEYGTVVKEGEKTIITPTGGMVSIKSADNPDRLRGAGLDFVVLDECAFMKQNVWAEVVRPTLTERRGGALFISTPKGYNWFEKLFENAKGLDDWERWQLPTTTNPFVPLDELEIARTEIGSFLYAQEYEAQFIEQAGGLFDSAWFKYYTMTSRTVYNEYGYEENERLIRYDQTEIQTDQLRIITSVDLATSTKESADYTVITTVGVSKDQRVFVLDVVRARLEAPQVLKALIQHYDKWTPEIIGIERAGYQLAFIQMVRSQTNLPIRELKADKDKYSRSLPLSAKMEQGQVYFDKQSNWYLDLEREMLQFPAGEHDDQVDSLAYCILQLARKNEFRAY